MNITIENVTKEEYLAIGDLIDRMRGAKEDPFPNVPSYPPQQPISPWWGVNPPPNWNDPMCKTTTSTETRPGTESTVECGGIEEYSGGKPKGNKA